jgi:hypothetical protein
VTAKRVRSTGRPQGRRRAHIRGDCSGRDDGLVGLDGVRVHSPLTLALGRHVAERLSALANVGI